MPAATVVLLGFGAAPEDLVTLGFAAPAAGYGPDPTDRIVIDRLVRGATRVGWTIAPGFCAARGGLDGLAVTLQRGEAPDEEAWEDVAAGVDVAFLVDPEARRWPRREGPYYRVLVADAAAGRVYASRAVRGRGDPDGAAAVMLRELLRREYLRLEATAAGLVAGWLLKRRVRGPTPPATPDPAGAVDPITGGVVNTLDPATRGVPVVGGYWAPIPCRVDLGLGPGSAPAVEPNRGAVDPNHEHRSRMPGDTPIAALDVFVADRTDARYLARRVTPTAAVGDVPAVLEITFAKLDESDPAYGVPVPDRWPWDQEASDVCTVRPAR